LNKLIIIAQNVRFRLPVLGTKVWQQLCLQHGLQVCVQERSQGAMLQQQIITKCLILTSSINKVDFNPANTKTKKKWFEYLHMINKVK